MYVRYFGKTPTKAQIDEYAEVGKPKEILNQIMGDANDAKPSNITYDDYIDSIFQNLFGRPASGPEKTKYAKTYDKEGVLPINSIVKSAKKSDKDVYQTKKLVALLIAEKGSTTDLDLDKITKDTYKEIYNPKTKKLVGTLAEVKTIVDAMEDNVTGQTFNLTAGVDMGSKFVGTEKGDIYYSLDALIPSTLAQKETWTTGDTLDGKEGNDILNIQTGIAMAGTGPDLNLTSIETVNVNSTNTVILDGSDWDGTNTLNVTKATAANLTAAATTDVNVSGVTNGTVAVDGGKNINVTVAATGTTTTIGATTGAKGTVTVTDTAQAGSAIKVDGGTDVTITASGNTGGTIDVGQAPVAASPIPTGTVKVSSTGSYTDGGATSMGAINIKGGSTVTVTQSAGITDAQKTAALTDTSNYKVIQGAIGVTGGNSTTTVNVKQDATVAGGNATLAVAGSTQTQTVTFNALAAGNTVTVNGLTFTAAKDLSAAEVAAAFANLTSVDTQSNTGITTNGSYTGSNTAGFTTGAVVGNTVVYSETVNGAGASVAAPSAAKGTGVTTPTAPTIATTTTGATTTPAVDGKIGVDAGLVTIADTKATDTIKTVTIDGYKTGSSVTSDALTDLTLKNADKNAVFTVTNAVASSSLTLNVDNITTTGTAEIDLDGSAGKITTLTINATGSDSEFILTGTGIKDLTINATADLDISGSAATAYATTALKTVDVNGAGSVNLGDLTNSALNTFDASGNTGGVTAEINTLTASVGTITEYVFSAGNDIVTLAETTVNTKVTLGAGDDIVTLASGTTALAAVIDGGTGSDTLAMVVADANTVTSAGTSDFENKISGFEKLSLTATAANAAVDLSLFDDINYVISAGTAAFTLALSNMANNGTLELTGATNATGDITVTMANASGNTDTFNIVTKVDASDITFAGDVVVAGVETININAIDLSPVNTTTGVATIEEASLILTANLAKTVNVKGNSDVDLTLTGSTLVTLIDGSSMTGALTATTAVSSSAATIKGGSGADDLTADTTNDKLYGNAGADTITVANGANLVQLYGGEGKDTYVIGVATNSNGYATINGTKAELSGDIIKFGTTIAGMSSLAKIDNLGSTAVFQDYVNEAAKGTTTDNKVAWFQLDGNTYVVQNNSALNSFANGVDAVVKITGLVDLTFNGTTNVLEIA